jgi:hypothetical protein
VVADINGFGVVIHVRVGGDVFGRWVVGEEKLAGFSIAVKHYYIPDKFAAVSSLDRAIYSPAAVDWMTILSV